MAAEHAHYHNDHDAHGAHDAHHVTPLGVYLRTFVALLVLMALTILVSYWDLGPFNNAVAMAIAITKAVLVVLFFMGVKYGTKLTWLWAAIGFIWFLIMFGIVSDYFSREWIHQTGWEKPVP
jgi:cytochrome c oxidase subunit 4